MTAANGEAPGDLGYLMRGTGDAPAVQKLQPSWDLLQLSKIIIATNKY